MGRKTWQQLIYYGAPGTGKSHEVNQLVRDTEIIRVTIHPEYSYSDFIGQVLPYVSNGDVGYKFVPGPMTQAIVKALGDRATRVSLILEELSRGNVAAIFGDMFQLLDRDAEGNSKYPIKNDYISELIPDTEEWIRGAITPGHVYFPANLSIFGTVNLNDQNVNPMDTAFKRRFDWRYVSTAPVREEAANTYINNPKIRIPVESGDAMDVSWVQLYQSINSMIMSKDGGLGRSEDSQIGQFFIVFDEQDIRNSLSSDAEEFNRSQEMINCELCNKLFMYLWEDVQQGGVYPAGKTLFCDGFASFEELYFAAKNGRQCFSDTFINTFLRNSLE